MRRLNVPATLVATLLFPLVTTLLVAQSADLLLEPSTTVGTAPAQIVVDEIADEIHVLHSGSDRNFNGIVELDSGDVAASWYKLDRSGRVIDSLDFGLFFNSYPVRAAFDFKFNGGTLYAPIGGAIASYDTETMTVIEQELLDVPGSAVTWDEGGESLIIALRAPDFTSPGRLLLFVPELGMTIGSILAGVNPADGIANITHDRLGIERYFLINEGGGSGDASLTMIGVVDNIFGRVNENPLGGGSSSAVIAGEEAFVLLNQEGILRVINRTTHKEIDRSPITIDDTLQAVDVAVDSEYIALLARGGVVLVYDRDDHTLIERRSVPTSGSSIAVGGGKVYVVGPYSEGGDPTIGATFLEIGGGSGTLVTPESPSNVWHMNDQRIVVVGDSGESGWWKMINLDDAEGSTSGSISLASLNSAKMSAFHAPWGLLGVTDGTTLIEIDVTENGSSGNTVWSSEERIIDRIVAGDQIWLMANYPGDFAPELGYILGVEMETGVEHGDLAFSISEPYYPIPALSEVEGAWAFYGVPISEFGQSDTDLRYAEFHPNLFEGTLGSFANHITRGAPEYCPEEFYTMVTMSGTHEVVYLDGLKGVPVISSRTPTGTSGFDGPRASSLAPCVPAIFCGATLTTTYGGELILHFDGNVLDRQELEGRGEGIALLGDTAWAANVLETDSFSEPGTTVTPATVTWPPGSVTENLLPEQSLSVRHDRSTDELSIRLELEMVGEVEVQLIDMKGRPVLTPESYQAESGVRTMLLTTRELPTGTYLVTVETPEGSAVRIVQVVR